jgi:hypothetical protein
MVITRAPVSDYSLDALAGTGRRVRPARFAREPPQMIVRPDLERGRGDWLAQSLAA